MLVKNEEATIFYTILKVCRDDEVPATPPRPVHLYTCLLGKNATGSDTISYRLPANDNHTQLGPKEKCLYIYIYVSQTYIYIYVSQHILPDKRVAGL